MLILKIFTTALIIIAILFAKSLIKLYVTKKTVERELAEISIKKINKPGVVKSLSILPLIDYYSENEQLQTEAGVSYYIQADEVKILLDVGANSRKEHPSALISNMKILDKTFDELDFIYLSHLHLDHIGGMKNQRNATFSVSTDYVNLPEIPVYSPEPVMPSKLNMGPVPEVLTEPCEIRDGIISIGAIPRALYLMGYTLENALAFNVEGKGIVLLIGCGHQSVEKIIERSQLLFNEKIYGIIGGLHLPAGEGRMKIGPIDIQSVMGIGRPPWNVNNKKDVETAIAAIKEVNPAFIALSPHESSEWTLSRFREEFGSKCHDIKVGCELVL